jgi:hypothetical protein
MVPGARKAGIGGPDRRPARASATMPNPCPPAPPGQRAKGWALVRRGLALAAGGAAARAQAAGRGCGSLECSQRSAAVAITAAVMVLVLKLALDRRARQEGRDDIRAVDMALLRALVGLLVAWLAHLLVVAVVNATTGDWLHTPWWDRLLYSTPVSAAALWTFVTRSPWPR